MTCLCVTGTDTGVGKTVVSAALAAHLIRRGLRVVLCKPVETGCLSVGGRLVGVDGQFLSRVADTGQREDEIVLEHFLPPVAPLVAAGDRRLDVTALCDQIRELERSCDIVIVEGAGGLLVPIAPQCSFADMFAELDAVVLCVVGSRLGALNHSALTFEVLRARQLPCVGYVLNNNVEPAPDEDFSQQLRNSSALSSNRETLRTIAESYAAEELDVFPFLADIGDWRRARAHIADGLGRQLAEKISPLVSNSRRIVNDRA